MLICVKGMDAGMKSYLIFEVPKEFESEGKGHFEENLWNFNLTFQVKIIRKVLVINNFFSLKFVKIHRSYSSRLKEEMEEKRMLDFMLKER